MDQFIKSIETLLVDNTSGSGDLLASMIRSVKDLVSRTEPGEGIDTGLISKQLIRIGEEKPVFLVLQHFTGEFLQVCLERSSLPGTDINNFIDDYMNRWNHVNELITNNLQQLADLSGKTILLHSNSSTVYGLFREIASYNTLIRIIQTESRPVMEGRIQASKLAGQGYRVTLITDACISRYMEQADLAILGADAIYPDFFINKSGSYSIALACREYSKSCLVVCDSRKLCLNKEKEIAAREAFDQPASAREIWNDPPSTLNIENHYFEKTPNSLVSYFVFEDNSIAGNRIIELVR